MQVNVYWSDVRTFLCESDEMCGKYFQPIADFKVEIGEDRTNSTGLYNHDASDSLGLKLI